MEIDRTRGRGAGGMRRRDVRCYRCGRMGHIARNCTTREDIRVADADSNEQNALEEQAYRIERGSLELEEKDRQDFQEAERA